MNGSFPASHQRLRSKLLESSANRKKLFAHRSRILGFFDGFVGRDQFAIVETEQMGIHQDHPESSARLDIGIDPKSNILIK